MKSLAGVVFALVLVVAVAVAGSQARPVPRANPLLQICEQTGPVVLDSARCKPVALLAAPGGLERDFMGDIGGDWANEAGGDYSDPDWVVEVARKVLEAAVKAGAVALAAELVEQALEWVFADGYSGRDVALVPLDSTLFDPQD